MPEAIVLYEYNASNDTVEAKEIYLLPGFSSSCSSLVATCTTTSLSLMVASLTETHTSTDCPSVTAMTPSIFAPIEVVNFTLTSAKVSTNGLQNFTN